MESPKEKFDRCHSGGHAYETYKKLEPKFTKEFKQLTFEVLIETYLRSQLNSPGLADREYTSLLNTWRSVAEELSVLSEYPYSFGEFPQAHPDARLAVVRAQELLGMR